MALLILRLCDHERCIGFHKPIRCPPPKGSGRRQIVSILKQTFLRRKELRTSEKKSAGDERKESCAVEVVLTYNLVPFGVGRRQPLGKSLALQELFLFIVGLLQQLRITPDPSYPLPSIYTCQRAFVHKPFPFRVHFENCN